MLQFWEVTCIIFPALHLLDGTASEECLVWEDSACEGSGLPATEIQGWHRLANRCRISKATHGCPDRNSSILNFFSNVFGSEACKIPA